MTQDSEEEGDEEEGNDGDKGIAGRKSHSCLREDWAFREGLHTPF